LERKSNKQNGAQGVKGPVGEAEKSQSLQDLLNKIELPEFKNKAISDIKKSESPKTPRAESPKMKIDQSNLYVRSEQKKPPKFPTVDLCNVFPGTEEWDKYWEKFNGLITSYYAEMDEYLKSMNDFTMDLEDYSKELRKIQMGNAAFAMKLGMNPNYKSTASISPKNGSSAQFTNAPLEPGIYNINGYIIKSGGARIPGLRLTTLGVDGFSLELDLIEIGVELKQITVESEYNVMTLTVPSKPPTGKARIIQIGVPNRSRVSDLSLKESQRTSKTGVKSRTLVITGH